MRTLLLTFILAGAVFAGCLGDDDDTHAVQPPVLPTAGKASHPAYGFLVNDDLPVVPNGSHAINEVMADGTIVWYKPAKNPLPREPTGMDFLAQTPGVDTSGGIAVFGSLGFVGGRSAGPLYVVDLRNPAEPTILGQAEDVPVRDADTILYPDGRLVVISTAGGKNMFATNVTDPQNPTMVGNFETTHGNHNIAVVPGTPIVYNSGGGGQIDIVDWSDPENPVEVGQFGNGNGCHDITFYINADEGKSRAYCAGYAQWEIWDIADPKSPVMLLEEPYPSLQRGFPIVGDLTEVTPDVAAFPGSFSHLAMVNHDATVFILGDENGGGGSNRCDFYLEGGEGQTYSGPIGNLWIYDILDENNPKLRGHVSPSYTDAMDGSCTAHFGRLIEDTGFIAMGFYAAGVVLIDFRDLDNPRIVDRYDAGGDIWDVWYHQGYLMTGDMSRGMDILTLR